MSGTLRSIKINSARVVGAAILGAVASVLCTVLVLVLPFGFALLLVFDFSRTAFVQVAVGVVLTLASSLFRVELGALILGWIAATAVGALIGGFVGTLLGYVSASLVLRRVSPSEEIDLEA